MGNINMQKKRLLKMEKDAIIDLFLLNIRNLWRVDGLYFLGIEKRFSTDVAIDIDKECWEIMGKIEAKQLKKFFGFKKLDITSFGIALSHTSWSFDHPSFEIKENKKSLIYRIRDCHTQKSRLKKGLKEFPCKLVRLSYLKSFAKEFSPSIDLICRVCPPDKHPDDLWCEWEFKDETY
ncbi:MAG: hypothetical protein DRG20_04625 [Deltaproteobacteria bacterium]|nr:hypothetical protein [Deltaproteobacteria bacterium]RLA89478.1 MAG: hypothetical protein DRG20_04625 [Deltaproteobacteria bacterium]